MPTGRKAMKGGEGRRVGNMELLLFEAAKQGSSVELGYVLELPEGEWRPTRRLIHTQHLL